MCVFCANKMMKSFLHECSLWCTFLISSLSPYLSHARSLLSWAEIEAGCSKFCTLGQNAGVEFHGLGHVALDFHLSVHEGVLGLEFASEKLHEVVVEHDECGVGLALFAESNRSVAVLEVDSNHLRLCAFILAELKVVDSANFGNNSCALCGEKWLNFFENLRGLEGHLFCVSKLNYKEQRSASWGVASAEAGIIGIEFLVRVW